MPSRHQACFDVFIRASRLFDGAAEVSFVMTAAAVVAAAAAAAVVAAATTAVVVVVVVVVVAIHQNPYRVLPCNHHAF